MSDPNRYHSPLGERYASSEMSYLFSPHYKFSTWRRLWVSLAKAQKALGLPITDAQIHSMEGSIHDINFEKAAEYEKILRHDVMAHIHAYGEQCPEAKGIIHLGATSCYVTDNTDLIQMQEGFKLLRVKLISVIRNLSVFAKEHKKLPCLSFTHYQSAQPTTVGKRACLWLQDFLLDLSDLKERLEDFRFLGVKGATGTQASFLTLFDNDHKQVKRLEELVAKDMGFYHLFKVSGQTYTRKQDARLLSVLNMIATSAHKMATDLRLLANLKEVEEPFERSQVGSSAMPYKRNPMRCERVCSLSRYLISLCENPSYTAATQWLERTLDDSANRRICIPEAFLCADAILNLLTDITAGLMIYPKVILKHLNEELPFLATEHILMEAAKKGKDRQKLHEKLRVISIEAGRRVKEEGAAPNLLEQIAKDPEFGLSFEELTQIAKVDHFIGRSEAQVDEFLKEEVEPILKTYHDIKAYVPKILV